MYDTLEANASSELPVAVLRRAKQLGFSDKQIAGSIKSTELSVRLRRQQNGRLNVAIFVSPDFLMIGKGWTFY